MKTYSFVRENAYKVLYPWNKDDTTGPAVWYEGQMSPRVGSFYQYLYFLFCPTLLYRDHYPRYLKIVRKMNIFNYYCNGWSCMYYGPTLSCLLFRIPGPINWSKVLMHLACVSGTGGEVIIIIIIIF